MDSRNKEAEIDVLDMFCDNDSLDQQIRGSENLSLLEKVLYLKYKRIMEGKSDKLPISFKPQEANIKFLNVLYHKRSKNLSVVYNILEKVLLVSQEVESQIQFLTEHLNNEILNEKNRDLLMLFNIILSMAERINQHSIFLSNINFNLATDFFLFVLSDCAESSDHCFAHSVLKKYFNLLQTKEKVELLSSVFEFCKENCNLSPICSLIDLFNEDSFHQKEFVLNQDEFWLFLRNCISDTDAGSLIQKQSIFVLAKAVNVIMSNNSIHNDIIKTENISIGIWHDYFTLVDIAKEKQLHLILPSLKLLKSVKFLHPYWQTCIFKILLNHSQNSVVYSVAIYILDGNYKDIFEMLLFSINKNEFSDLSVTMFNRLKTICLKMNSEEFEDLLNIVLRVPWNPTSLWCVLKSILNPTIKFCIDAKYFKNILNIIDTLPHIYVRKGCCEIVVSFILSNCSNKNFFKLSEMYKILRDLSDGKYVSDFIKISASEIVKHCTLNDLLIDRKQYSLEDIELYISCIKFLNINIEETLKYILKEVDDDVRPIIILNFPEISSEDDNFIEAIIGNELSRTDLKQRTTLLHQFKKVKHSTIIKSKVLNILDNPKTFSKNQILTALSIVKEYFEECSFLENLCMKDHILSNNDSEICNAYIDLYFLLHFSKENPGNKTKDILDLFSTLLDLQTDEVIINIYAKLESIVRYRPYEHVVETFVDKCYITLSNLTKNRCFKTVVHHFINGIFCGHYLGSGDHDYQITDICTTLLDLNKTHRFVGYCLLKKIKLFVYAQSELSITDSLIKVICELLLDGVIVRKEDRIEYSVCQEIFFTCRGIDSEENPNIMALSTRFNALETVIKLVSQIPHLPVEFATCLIEKYFKHQNKRYFPDSQIHLEKLRIFQALLVIIRFLKDKETKQTLINLILNSFVEETHQFCVRQLMQWTLYYLFHDNLDHGVEVISKIINETNKAKPHAVTTLIPVLYHLTVGANEKVWCETVNVLLPWTMGAQFKLRVYSQAVIMILITKAKENRYITFLNTYKFLETVIDSCIKASGSAFLDTLKTDNEFLNCFNPMRDYSLESIYVYIPKLNKVTSTEWENFYNYKFCDQQTFEIFNVDKTFASAVDESVNKNCNIETKKTEFNDCGSNVQRKITPWKDIYDNSNDNIRSNEFILIASLIDKPQNLGGLSRTCEVFGANQLVVHDGKVINDKEFKSLSMSSEKWVNIIEVKEKDLKEYLMNLKKNGYCVVGAEQTSQSIKLDEFKFHKKTVVLLGNEKEGIPADLILYLDKCLEIPQFGVVRSLNVHVAGAIFVWEYAKQHLV